MRKGIKACVDAKCVVSGLTLMFAAIDALAALTRRDGSRATRTEFMGWVNKYMLDELAVPMTAADLYGARCGILHSYAPTSDLSRRGDAKVLVYKWRHGHRPDDQVLEERARTATVVEIESLVEALDRAVKAFQDDVARDNDLRERVERHVTDLLCYEPWKPVSIVAA
jgi:hypothetical protein